MQYQHLPQLNNAMIPYQQQREAGQRFRYDFERAERQGLQPQSWSERVDGGLLGGGIPGRVLSAGRAHVHAAAALAHWEVAVVVRKICLEGQSVKAIAERTGEGREVVVKQLKAGLEQYRNGDDAESSTAADPRSFSRTR